MSKHFRYARYINFAMSFGITSVIALFAGIYGGMWVDERLGISPVFLLIGVFLAIAVIFKSLMTEVKALSRMEKESEEKNEEKE